MIDIYLCKSSVWFSDWIVYRQAMKIWPRVEWLCTQNHYVQWESTSIDHWSSEHYGMSHPFWLQNMSTECLQASTATIIDHWSSEHYGMSHPFRLQNMSTVYRHPQQPLATFLSLFGNYLAYLPHIVPTIIVVDFNEDLSRSTTSRVLQLMSSRGFSQLVQVPTTDSGSMLDHIYYNGIVEDAVIDVTNTYYSDHNATFFIPSYICYAGKIII